MNVLQGCMPALMTPCDAQGVPDFDVRVSTGKNLMATGVRRTGAVLVPTVRGHAWITAERELRFDPADPYRTGLAR